MLERKVNTVAELAKMLMTLRGHEALAPLVALQACRA